MDAIVVESWEQLATIPIAVAIALVLVEFAKRLIDLSGATCRRLSAVIGILVVVGATIAGGANPIALVLAVVNGAIAGTAASKTFDVGQDLLARDDG